MAGTRNRNMRGEYCLEQTTNFHHFGYQTYLHSSSGKASGQTLYAGTGLLPSRLPREELSKNPYDVESFLFGIGSNNLVETNPKDTKIELTNDIKTLDLYKKPTTILPDPLILEPYQRLPL